MPLLGLKPFCFFCMLSSEAAHPCWRLPGIAGQGRQVALRESGGTGSGGTSCPATYMGLGQLRRGNGGGKGGEEPGKCCASRSALPDYLKMMLVLEKPYFFREICAL